MIAMRKILFVLSGFAVHLASRSIASYTANSESFVQYAGVHDKT